MIIKVKNLNKYLSLNKSNKDCKILNNISLEGDSGDFISIIGPSGSGKSTLLHSISGLNKPTNGEIQILGKNPYKLNARKAAEFRRKNVGFIFQSYNLISSLSAIDNIILPLQLDHKKIYKSKIYKLLDTIRFKSNPNSFVSELSGGEQQKVAILRSLVSNSKIIFADEPTGSLDTISSNIIVQLLRKLSDDGKCVIMVTHDIEIAAKTDKSLLLNDGKISKVIKNPTSKQLFSEFNMKGE